MKTGICQKCGRVGLIQDHHILPRRFNDSETNQLCPNCHADYHEYSKKWYNSSNPRYHYRMYFRWLAGLCIICLTYLIIN